MIIDILLLVFAAAGFWLGYSKGLARTLFSIASYAIALLITLKITPWVMGLMIQWFGAGKMFALIFGTLFCLVTLILLITWMVRSVENYLKKSSFGSASQIGGGLIMMAVGILVCSFVLWTMVQFGWISEKVKSSSYSYAVLSVIPQKTGAFVEEFKPLFNRYWELTQETIAEGKSQPAKE